MTPSARGIGRLDLLRVDESLGDAERMTRDMVRSFGRDKLLPEIPQWFERGELPRDVAGELGRLGLLGMHLKGYGCAGAGAVAYGVACRELEAVDSGLRSFVSVQGSLAMFAIHELGSEAQKEHWLPRMASGEAIGCFALTEPDAGSDPSSMRTTARRDGADWIVSGTKLWITNGTMADLAVVWARTGEGIRGFLLESGLRGFRSAPVRGKLSLRASDTAELYFDDVRIPDASALPGATSLGAALRCLNEARYGIIWGAAGAARSCVEAAVEYASTRVQFGRPIAAFQLTQRKISLMFVEAVRAGLLALHLGRLKEDNGDLDPAQVSLGKLANVNAALAVAREARSVLGANGITLEYPVMRHMVNLESVVTYEGTADVHMLVVGDALTGFSAWR